MSAQFGFWDYIIGLGWHFTQVVVIAAVLALISWVLHELWNIEGPGPRK